MTTLNGISSEIATMLAKKPAAPFLFLGSGFSRRYIGLETWGELLEKFSEGVKDFNYYLGSADGSLPKAAELLAKDYFEYWWTNEKFEQSRVSQVRKIVRRQGFWVQRQRKLRESSAHLVGLIMRRVVCDASAVLRVSFV